MKQKKIILLNNKKKKLIGYLYKGSSKTIIITCHGIDSTNNAANDTLRSIVPPYWSEISRQTNASVFSFDFSGYGESEGEYFLSLKQRDAEIKTVIDYFSPYYTNIILYGFSMGAVSTAIATCKYKQVTGLITVNGFFSFNPTQLLVTHISMIFVYLISNPRFGLELYYWIKNFKVKDIHVPTLVVYSDKDPFVSPKQSLTFYNKLTCEKQIVAIQSNDHSLLKEHLQIPPKIADWLKKEKLDSKKI